VASGVSDRYLSKLDEDYLKLLAQEIKGNYIKGDSVETILDAMEKQKAAWRDQSAYELRYFLSLLALIFFTLRFISIENVLHLLRFRKDAH